MPRLVPFLFALLALVPSPSRAGGRTVLALHPLVVVGGEKTNEELQAILAAEVARLDVELVDSEAVHRFLQGQPNQSCIGIDPCLGELARATNASRSLVLILSPYSPKLVLTGRVVSASGEVLRAITGREHPKTSGESSSEALRVVLRQFLKDLEIDALELTPLVAAAPPALAPPAAVAKEVAPARQPSLLRPLSIGLLGVGAALGASSGIIFLGANADRTRLEGLLVEGALPGDQAASDLHRSVNTRGNFSGGLAIASAASLALGAVLFFNSGEPNPQVAVTANGNAAAVSLNGHF